MIFLDVLELWPNKLDLELAVASNPRLAASSRCRAFKKGCFEQPHIQCYTTDLHT